MRGIRSLNRTSDSPLQFSGNKSRSPILEIDSSMVNKTQAISPFVDRLMRLIEKSRCAPGEEFGVELALREALGNAVVHGNRKDPKTRVHVRCRCGPGHEISIVVADQGQGFDFARIAGEALASDPATEHGRGIRLMKAYMDDVHFERGGSEVHMRKHSRSRNRWRSKTTPLGERRE